MNNILKRLSELNNYKYSTISGLNDGEKYFLPSLFTQKTVIIVNNEETIKDYSLQLSALGKRVVSLCGALPLMISVGEKSSKIFKDYYINVSRLAKGDYDVLLLSPFTLFQKVPSLEYILNNQQVIKVGEDYSIKDLSSKLVSIGYINQEMVTNKGEFAVRGDLLDIYPVNLDKPIRVSFFDTEVEKINYFDPVNFKQEKDLKEVEIFCNTFFNISNIDKEELKINVEQNLSKLDLPAESMLRISNIVSNQFDCLDNNLSSLSSVFFLPFCNYFNASVLDYINQNEAVVFIDEPKLISDKLKIFEDETLENFLDLSLKGEFLPKTIEFYFTKKDVLKRILDFKLIAFARLLSQNKLFENEFVVNFLCSANKKYQNHFVELTEDVCSLNKNKSTIVLCCGLPLTLNKVKTFFDDEGLKYNQISSLKDIQTGQINITQKNIPFSANFEMEKFVLIGSKFLNNNQVLQVSQTQEVVQDKPKFLPKVGDYVVHQIHGVGKCVGIKNLKITSVFRDYIVIEYKDGDVLYLPSENADMLSAFVGEKTPKCNKIGGTEFFKVKQKVKNSIKEMAFDLVKVYSERMNTKGFKYSKDTYLQTEFENSFPYPYTPDQVQAIKDIKRDMESSKIMDRLLCGDVGFGKTEVALNAAFKAIQDGKQVAIICPTTILCEQHYNTALSRLKNFMVNVQSINRFKTKKEQDKILYDLKEGKIDLICGTHRLFSNDVKFKDLGLIILDEEQRFGVEDKEKLKNIKKSVDVLTLSATPIPRTLYMSLVGIRDVSFLSTPPKERKKINTAVIDYSDNLLVNACKKELERDGQILIVYNRVESITNFYAHIKSLLPDVNIGLAHGQMSPKMLESAIYDLYSRKTQILISTVLIENGIDLPYANTLFVIDSDKLGLSQLYQLRGRIGRSNIEAYAYFSFSRNKTLTEDSYKRLDAIMEFSDFGSGYKIAMRDLEIRGAGDVLGKMQHGHMEQVGYDMYVKLLNEAVSEIKGEKVEELKEIKIDIALNAYLPNTYISQNESRIDFYTKVSKLSSLEDYNLLIENTKNIYGSLPKPVEQLCTVGLIKNLAQQLKVKSIKIDEFNAKITFYDDVLSTKYYEFLSKTTVDFVLTQEKLPIITLRKQSDILKYQQSLLNFLINCLQIKNK
ncbi:MAG: transcription-repair coupling factor [Clostridia bacterium]|nr:transcription-repair coupling factor [Clostridia bacterium]